MDGGVRISPAATSDSALDPARGARGGDLFRYAIFSFFKLQKRVRAYGFILENKKIPDRALQLP